MEQLQHMAWSVILVTIILACLVTIVLICYAVFKVIRDYEYEYKRRKTRDG